MLIYTLKKTELRQFYNCPVNVQRILCVPKEEEKTSFLLRKRERVKLPNSGGPQNECRWEMKDNNKIRRYECGNNRLFVIEEVIHFSDDC